MDDKQRELADLALKASQMLGVSKVQAIEYGLRLIVATGRKEVEGITAENILINAADLAGEKGAFTMDDLIDSVFKDQPIFSPHKIKIFSGKVLSASGYVRRQYRRENNARPLLWVRETEAL